jgi:hypothetical protein
MVDATERERQVSRGGDREEQLESVEINFIDTPALRLRPADGLPLLRLERE